MGGGGGGSIQKLSSPRRNIQNKKFSSHFSYLGLGVFFRVVLGSRLYLFRVSRETFDVSQPSTNVNQRTHLAFLPCAVPPIRNPAPPPPHPLRDELRCTYAIAPTLETRPGP